jgi:hypothetical protein
VDAATDDSATRALDELSRQLERIIHDLRTASNQAQELLDLRAAGRSWLDIVSNEQRPLIIERITRAIDDLGAVGGSFRREEALALYQENVSITKISQLFGVSRQRVSVLVRPRPEGNDGSHSQSLR